VESTRRFIVAKVRRDKRSSAIDGQDFERAAHLRDRMKEEGSCWRRSRAEKQWKYGDIDRGCRKVDEEQIARCWAKLDGYPVFS